MDNDITDKNDELDPIFKDKDLVKPPKYPRMKKRMKKIVLYIGHKVNLQCKNVRFNYSFEANLQALE